MASNIYIGGKIVIILLVITWVVCGILAYGLSFAYWQGQYSILAQRHYRGDMLISILLGLTGIAGVVVAIVGSRFAKHGLKFY